MRNLLLIWMAISLHGACGSSDGELGLSGTASSTERGGSLPSDSKPTEERRAQLTAHIGQRGSHTGHERTHTQAGLPKSCLTYSQRYKREYYRGLGHSWIANAQTPSSRFVVVLQLHLAHGGGRRMPMDELLNIRALATEVTAAGYHFYILLQVPTRDFYMQTDPGEVVRTREEVLQELPFDLRTFVIVHDFEADFRAYPALLKEDDASDLTVSWGPGPRASYVAMSQFMQMYKAYQFAWVVEYDVRWTGQSWGEFLNAALSLGQQSTEEEVQGHQFRVVLDNRAASVELPRSMEGLPDLLTFGGVDENDKWKHLGHNMANASRMWETATTVYGGSRRLWDAAHESSLKGVGSHIETFLPTLGLQSGMKVVSVETIKPPGMEEPFHCCSTDAKMLYSKWFNDSQSCSESYILHAVRAREPFWPLPNEAQLLPSR